MSYTVKIRGDSTRPMLCVYRCPEHGEFDAEVMRDETGGAPEVIPCPVTVGWEGQAERPPGTFGATDPGNADGSIYEVLCKQPATWTPSAVACRVRRIEAVKGKWEKPEKRTYLDTRELGEGQDIDDFREKRAKIWEEKRQQDVMAFKKGF